VFCEEAETETGHARSFVAAALPALWRRYKALPPYARHCYEVCQIVVQCSADTTGWATLRPMLWRWFTQSHGSIAGR
jgi:hypothetical protein